MGLSYCALYKVLLYYCNHDIDSVISEAIDCFEIAYSSIILLLQIRLTFSLLLIDYFQSSSGIVLPNH